MFIEVTQIQNGKEMGKRLLNVDKIEYIEASKDNCNVMTQTELFLAKESYEEIKQMINDCVLQGIKNILSYENTPWSSLSEETREAFLDELKQAREGLESRLGDK